MTPLEAVTSVKTPLPEKSPELRASTQKYFELKKILKYARCPYSNADGVWCPADG